MTTATALCQFAETTPGELWTCSVCGFPAKTSHLPERPCGPWEKRSGKPRPKSASKPTAKSDPEARERKLQETVGPCAHRGAIIEAKKTCQVCGARGELYDLYACDIHGTCSLGKRASGLKMCAGCEDATACEQSPQNPHGIAIG